MNQTGLGKALGISFQQVHKYESGIDRIAAGTLQKIGGVLGIHPGEFFGENVCASRRCRRSAGSHEHPPRTMQKIVSPAVRKRFAALIRSACWSEHG